MAIFQLSYRREVVEEAVIYVEADDEALLRQNLDQIEGCLPGENWQPVDEDDYELSGLHEMTPEQVRIWGAHKKVYEEHHFHYEDTEPEPEPPDSRQLKLFEVTS